MTKSLTVHTYDAKNCPACEEDRHHTYDAENCPACEEDRQHTYDAENCPACEEDRQRRRWIYRGTELHHGSKYHIWENELTGQKFAKYAPYYLLETTGRVVEV